MFNSVSTPSAGETSRIRSFMGRSTPAIGVLKTKFLTVLGNSNELLNGISSRFTLNISSSDSDYCDDDEDEEVPKFDESIDYTKIDYESRRVKARRAHEEIISGRYRQPNLAPRPQLDALRNKRHEKTCSSSSTSSSSSSTSTSSRSFFNNADEKMYIGSTTRSDSLESRNSGGYERARAIPGARRSELDIQRDLMRLGESGATVKLNNVTYAPHIEVQPPLDREFIVKKQMQSQQHQQQQQQQQLQPQSYITSETSGAGSGVGAIAASNHSIRVPPIRRKNSNSSTLTSLRDDPEIQISPSVESTDWRNFIRSESQNSVPSWASSISLDCRTGEESIKEFMKRFTQALFYNAHAIDVELKAEFGPMIRMDIGRQWFARFLLEQKNKYTRVNEMTFHSLVQYFTVILFECKECEDFHSATVIMNLCFMFYREVEVPGCEPYREYLFTYMREQPIWLCVRFWTAAFSETLQNERDHRLAAHQKKLQRHQAKDGKSRKELQDKQLIKEDLSTSSSSHRGEQHHEIKNKAKSKGAAKSETTHDIDKEMENIGFRHLGAFTCNIHALGIPQEVCLEFFKKSVNGLNLSKDKVKLVRDNIQRMYYETDLWGAKQS